MGGVVGYTGLCQTVIDFAFVCGGVYNGLPNK